MGNQKHDAKRQRLNQANAARKAAERKQKVVKVIAAVIVLALIVGTATLLSLGSSSTSTTATKNSPTTLAGDGPPKPAPAVPAGKSITGDTPCPPATGATERASHFEKVPPLCIDPNKTYTATFDTTEGTIVTALDVKKTPNTANNFIVLSRYKYYDGSTIFRTDPSIDIFQGGSPNTQDNSDPGPGYEIKDEGSGFTYNAGDLIMARRGVADSASAQYFFATGPNVSNLNEQGTYVTFGHITSGLDVAQKIMSLNVSTGSNLGGAPSHTVTVNHITITES